MDSSGSRPSVLVLARHLDAIGGIAFSSLEAARGLAERGWSVRCAYREAGALQPDWERFATVSACGEMTFSGSRALRTASSLRRVVALGRGTDLVHVHSVPHFEFARVAAAMSRAKLVVHLHGEPPQVGPRVLRAVRRAALVIAVSASTADHWRRLGTDREIEVVGHGVPMEDVPLLPMRPASSALDPLDVLFLGRPVMEKGIDIMVEAFDLARESLPDGSTLTVVGGSKSAQESASAAALLSAPGVCWEGPTTNVWPYLANADVTVIPSRSEAFGRVAVESMAVGTPVIAADVGGLAAVASSSHTNRLVPAEDPGSLAEALVTFSANRPVSGRESQDLRSAAEGFALDRSIHDLESLLLRCAGA